MKFIRIFIFYWLPMIVWMATIFFFSSRQRFGITDQSTYDFFIFKVLHMLEYGGLYFWVLRVTKLYSKKNAYIYAFVITILYAFSDELHQLLIPTREGRFRDVIIDTIGMTFAYLLIRSQWEKVKRYFK